VFGERHLRHILLSYMSYHNEIRTHLSLEKDAPISRAVELAERGLKVDYRAVWNFVHAEKLSFKKNRGGQRARSTRRGVPAGAVAQVSRPHRA
jgi:hypothetical protein